MGVINLWTELAKYDNVFRTWSGSGASGGDTRGIVAELNGKVLAIDTSVWIFQCSQQSELKEAIFDEHARVLYTFHNRILSLLRYGATPVFVLEGDTPEAKRGRLQQRSLARGLGGCVVGNRRGGRHDALGRKVVELLDLLGIPHVDAPGEAEALCAALVTAGLAGGVVSSDVDALLFGATHVYRECRLSMDQPKLNVLERADAGEAARRCFGLRGGGGCTLALRAVACLCGCDYSVSGGKGVGVKTAMEAVQMLTLGQQDDSSVLPELLRFLATGPDPRVTQLKACTGCKNCGHDKHGRQPCEQCGPGPCRPKAEGAPCGCAFHRSEPQRKFMRVIARAVGTSPSFADTCRAALEAFESETQSARAAAEALRRRGFASSWSPRPDVHGVFSLLHPLLGRTSSQPDKLLWTYGEVRDKLRPVLLEWDMRQGPEPPEAVRGLVEFRPRRIKQVASKDGEDWAYLVEFDRLPGVNTPDAAFDTAQLSSARLSKQRHVRQDLVRDLWPQLLARREEEEQAKLEKPKKGRRKGAATASQSPGGAASGGCTAPGSGGGAGASGGGGSRGRGRARPAATAPASDVTAGSRDVMMRFLHMGSGAASGGAGGDAPTASVQMLSPMSPPPPPRHRQQEQHQDREEQQRQQQPQPRTRDTRYNPYLSEEYAAVLYGGAGAADSGAADTAAAAGGGGGGAAAGPSTGRGRAPLGGLGPADEEDEEKGGDEDDDWDQDMDFQMTQRNDAPPPPPQRQQHHQPAPTLPAGRRLVSEIFPGAAAAPGGGAGPSGVGAAAAAGGGGGNGGGSFGQGAKARAWQPLWSDNGTDGDERSAGGHSAGDDGALYDGGGAGAAATGRRASAGRQAADADGDTASDDLIPVSPTDQRLMGGGAAAGRTSGLIASATQRPTYGAGNGGGGGGGRSGGGGGAAAAAGDGSGGVEVFDLTDSPAGPAPPLAERQQQQRRRRRSAAATTAAAPGEGSGERLQLGASNAGAAGPRSRGHDAGAVDGEEQHGQQEEEEEDGAGDGDALGSAVKPSATGRAAAAGASNLAAQGGAGAGAGGDRGTAAAVAAAGARHARLLRSLFPDREPPSPLLATPQARTARKKAREEAPGGEADGGGGVEGGAAGPLHAEGGAAPSNTGHGTQQEQQEQEQQVERSGGRRPDSGPEEGSPSKRRNTGDSDGGGGQRGAPGARGRGAGGAGGAATSAAGAATTTGAAAAPPEPVDLTLTDSDDEGTAGGGDRGIGGDGTCGAGGAPGCDWDGAAEPSQRAGASEREEQRQKQGQGPGRSGRQQQRQRGSGARSGHGADAGGKGGGPDGARPATPAGDDDEDEDDGVVDLT